MVTAAAAGAAAWAGGAELATPARAVAAILVGILPLLLAAQSRIDPDAIEHAPVEAVYFSSMLLIWAMGALALWAGTASGFSRAAMALRPVDPAIAAAWVGGVTLIAIAIALVARRLGMRESRALEWLLPQTTRERAVFVLLSISAGVGEEMAYRAFLIPALERASGSLALAVLLSSAAFGMVHGYQQAAGAVRATLLGVVLAIPMVVTGSVIPSMLAHALYDVLAGLFLADWLMPGRTRPRRRGPREH